MLHENAYKQDKNIIIYNFYQLIKTRTTSTNTYTKSLVLNHALLELNLLRSGTVPLVHMDESLSRGTAYCTGTNRKSTIEVRTNKILYVFHTLRPLDKYIRSVRKRFRNKKRKVTKKNCVRLKILRRDIAEFFWKNSASRNFSGRTPRGGVFLDC